MLKNMVKWERWENLKNTNENAIEGELYNNLILEEFKKIGLPLNDKLRDMLSETEEHQGGRRGCGFTQATRVLANYINVDNRKCKYIFDIDKIEMELLKKGGWELLDNTKIDDIVTKECFNNVLSLLNFEAHKKFVILMMDLFNLRELPKDLPVLNIINDNLAEVGTCTTAEIYFYDYLDPRQLWCGSCRLPNCEDMQINIIVNENGEPVFLEKQGIGEKSAITVSAFILNGCEIPAGSLVQIDYDNSSNYQITKDKKGFVIPIDKIKGVRFLRFTPLVSPPNERGEVFSSHIQFQIKNEMYKAETLIIQDFKDKIKTII